MPNGQIPRVQDTSRKELLRGLGVLVVSLRTNIPNKSDLANLLPAALDIDHGALRHIGLDDPRGQTCHKAMSLARHLLVLLL